MVNAIFNGLISFINIMVNFWLTPINVVVAEFFPDFNDYVTQFYTIVDTYIVPFINFGFHLLPPNAMRLAVFYLSMIVIFYTITLATHFIIKVVEIIKNVKIW